MAVVCRDPLTTVLTRASFDRDGRLDRCLGGQLPRRGVIVAGEPALASGSAPLTKPPLRRVFFCPEAEPCGGAANSSGLAPFRLHVGKRANAPRSASRRQSRCRLDVNPVSARRRRVRCPDCVPRSSQRSLRPRSPRGCRGARRGHDRRRPWPRTRSRTRPRRSERSTPTRAPSRRSTRARPLRPPLGPLRTWASGVRSSTGRSSACTSRCCRTARFSPTTRSATTRPRRYPVQDHTRATVWDPATGTQTPVNVDTGFNIFCSGLAHLVDGRMFIAGGNKDQQLNGIVQTHLFDPATNLWSLGPNMAAGRWYPTVTPLSNGEMLITSGRVDTPEVRTLAGGLRALSTASLSLPLYPWMDVAPNGRAFYSGPDQTLRALDTAGTGAWQALGQRDTINRDYGGHALFDVGKMLVAGGGPSTKDARVVDVNGASPQVSTTAPMAYGRRQHNLTVLADGSVLATGGNSSGRRARRPQRRRLPGRTVEPRHRAVADSGRDADHAPVPLDRAAAARRARPVLRWRDLRHVRPGRLSGQERGGLLAALPLPGRRHARATPRHRRRAGVCRLRRADGDRDR